MGKQEILIDRGQDALFVMSLLFLWGRLCQLSFSTAKVA